MKSIFTIPLRKKKPSRELLCIQAGHHDRLSRNL